MNLKHTFLKLLVWNMRWMTRYLGFIARPFVKWYADQEVIACGLRRDIGDVCIIYSPMPGRLDHSFFKKEGARWSAVDVSPTGNFSGDMVHQVVLPNAKIGEDYIVRVQKKNKSRMLRSPKITIKESTYSSLDLIEVRPLPNGGAYISWQKGEKFNPMIYFLAIENSKGESLAGIYTRENFWQYPLLKKASLSIGKSNPELFQKNKKYTAKLTIVDFDGWVSCMSQKVFTY